MEIKKPSTEFSRKATLMSFVTAVIVVYIHSNNLTYYGLAKNGRTFMHVIEKIFGNTLGEVAVPFFFMLSAYWLFRFDIHSKDTKEIMRRKLTKKVRTVLLPYLLWNAFGTLFYMAVTNIPATAGLLGGGEPIKINLQNLFSGIFLYKYYFPFWYLYNLIILTALAPLLLFVLRNRIASCICLGATAVIAYFQIPLYIIKSAPLFYFVLGAVLAVYGRELFEKRSKLNPIAYAVLFVGFCIVRFFGVPVISRLFLLASPFVMWKAGDLFLTDKVLDRKPKWFCRQSFFIYAAHIIPVTVVGHVMAKVSGANIWIVLSYLITPWITLIILYVVARLLHKFTPKFYGLICGGRG